MYKLITADIMNWLNLASRYGYRQNYWHAMLLDPPYHLTSITKRFGKGTPAKYGKDGAFQRASKGFMGQTWDGGDLAFNPELWFALKERLLPGAFCFAFAGSRGWHRMAIAIEDAGFIMHPTIFLWAYGSGFPKATNISTQIDKAAGVEREIVKEKKQSQGPESMLRRKAQSIQGYRPEGKEFGQLANDSFFITAPATPEAAQWEGHRYGLQAIKPASEVLLMFSKPLNYEPIYGIISETTFFVEAILCLLSPVQDVENLTNQIHQHLKVVVGNSAQDNADVWELLKSVKFVGLHSESNLADFTLQNFVVENVLTRDAMLHLVKIIIIGQIQDGLSVKDINISESEIANILLNIGLLWQNILAELLNRGSMYITSTATDLITDLKILNCYLSQIILDSIIQGEHIGILSLAQTAENLLRSVLIKLPLLNNTFAQENVIETLAKRGLDPEANQEDGSRVEPILCFQKPYEGRPVDNIVETGAGALNIDGGRIGTKDKLDGGGYMTPVSEGWDRPFRHNDDIRKEKEQLLEQNVAHAEKLGRWPSNLILSHHPDCKKVGVKKVGSGQKVKQSRQRKGFMLSGSENNIQEAGNPDNYGKENITDWQCVDDCSVRKLGEQSGELKSGNLKGSYKGGSKDHIYAGGWGNPVVKNFEANEGTASRFFYQSHFAYEIAEQIAAADPVRYVAKVDKKERNAGLNKPNIHPTLKPIALTKYLASLLLPPDSYTPRRILVPFSGSGSEMIGAMLAGWDEVTGIEMTKKYIPIARTRLEWWSHYLKWGQDNIDIILDTISQNDDQQLSFIEEL